MCRCATEVFLLKCTLSPVCLSLHTSNGGINASKSEPGWREGALKWSGTGGNSKAETTDVEVKTIRPYLKSKMTIVILLHQDEPTWVFLICAFKLLHFLCQECAKNILPPELSKGGHWTRQIGTFPPSDETFFKWSSGFLSLNFLHIDERFQLNTSAYFKNSTCSHWRKSSESSEVSFVSRNSRDIQSSER